MLFFDLEAYAPPDERTASRGSLIVNPARPGHILLGGCFFSRRFADPFPEAPEVQGLWLWHFGSERALLRAIRERFEAEWARQRAENARVLGKPVVDLVVCGAGIARFDLPALYCRSLLHEVASAVELYELYFKARPIDLSNEAGFLFPEEPHLYPKTTRELAGRLGLRERKGSSKSVWDSYERGEHEAIERRTADELRLVLELYRRLRERVVPTPPP
ncbi:hypothetical protein [Melittangium boletus]|uniref:Uncharacterized protein n=1 Tax=Melittangium boletus DSM 14713 TaxID=1294270 RepID=A0A250IFW5_9BACT|nr:hypothetical protein [Melittangium boletus]ATB30057.1 hypothetical protein MEBOL_003512 [Melittangium boletus DSM 14713]